MSISTKREAKWYFPPDPFLTSLGLPVAEEDTEAVIESVVRALGKPGRVIYGGDRVLHNIYLVAPSHGELWYGDLDITDDLPVLMALAKDVNVTLFVIREQDRFVKGFTEMVFHADVVVAPNELLKHRYIGL